MRRVVIGFLGTTLDRGSSAKRWSKWRPSVDVCRHENLTIDQFELLCSPNDRQLYDRVSADINEISPQTTVRLNTVDLADPWDFEEVYGALYEWMRNYSFTPETHEYLVHITTGSHVAQISWFLLTEARHIPGRLLQLSPPPKEQKKEAGSYRIIDLDLGRYDGIARRFQRESLESIDFLKSGIATRNQSFNQLIENIEKVAILSREPILLTGPTGAGKSKLAGRIHALKKERQRLTGPFVEVNCATVRGDGAMSALFGHIKGAYTGATQRRPGLLKTADQGVLFLDEIGELGLDEQAMLLRAIEEKSFVPVGSDTPISSDFQLLAGTNQDLRALVAAGRFREDLLARINLWTFTLPGLRHRHEDIEPNLEYELAQWEKRYGRRVTMNVEARKAFLKFAQSSRAVWSGNFRDLNAAMTRMSTMAPGDRIDMDTVKAEIGRLEYSWRLDDTGHAGNSLEPLLGADGVAELDRFDIAQLKDVIAVCRDSKSLSDAGRTLFAVSRTRKANPNDADRLRKYLARFGLDWKRVNQVSE